MALRAVCEKTRREIKRGDKVKDFRGDEFTFLYATRANQGGRQGKVFVTTGRAEGEYYASVFGLYVECR